MYQCGVKMILPVQNYNNYSSFTAKRNGKEPETGFPEEKEEYLPVTSNGKKISKSDLKKHQAVLVDNTLHNRMHIAWDKLNNALTMYPARGLEGSKNSNFYEFLTMGTIPYLTGSAMLMAVFNTVNKLFEHNEAKSAAKLGNKMALGVLFYGMAKSISKSFVTTPVKWFTGVDTEQPYVKLCYKLPERKDDSDTASVEFHKVYESLEFPYWDLNYGDVSKGEKRNGYYDKISKKLGLGTNLNDSDQDAKPRIKEIAVKSNLAKTFSSYLWAAVGVGLAMQKPWEDYFNVATLKFWQPKKFLKSLGTFCDCAVDSAKSFVKGAENAKGFWKKYSGLALLSTAALSTVVGVVNVLTSSDKPSKLDSGDIIEKDRKYVVN